MTLVLLATLAAAAGVIHDFMEDNPGASEETFNFVGQYANATQVTTVEKGIVTLEFAAGENTQNPPKYYTSGTAVRFYGKNTLKVSVPDTHKLVKVTFTTASNNFDDNVSVSTGDYTHNGTTATWTFTDGNEGTLTNTNTSGHFRIQVIKVEYTLASGSTLQDPNISFASTEVTANLGEDFEAPFFYNPNIVPVTFTSSDEEVATVVATSGVVTIVGAGTTTITAKSTATEDYYSDQVSYTLTVIDTNTTDYVLVTDPSQLVDGAKYLIVYKAGSKAMSYKSANNSSGCWFTPSDVDIVEDIITVPASGNSIGVVELHKSNDKYTLYLTNGDKNGYLYAPNGNFLDTQDTPAEATIEVSDKTTVKFDNERYIKYNSSSPRFACYLKDQMDINLYKAVDESEIPAVEAPVIKLAKDNGVYELVMTCATEGAEIKYWIGDAEEAVVYSAPVAVGTGNYTVRAVAVKDENTSTEVTFNVPLVNVVTEFSGLETGDNVSLNAPVTVVYTAVSKSNTYTFVKAGETFMLVYNNTQNVKSGETYASLVGTYAPYSGLPEMTGVSFGEKLEGTTHVTPMQLESLADVTDELLCQYVTVNNVTVTGTVVEDANGNSLTLFDRFGYLPEGEFTILEGFVGKYNNVLQIYPVCAVAITVDGANLVGSHDLKGEESVTLTFNLPEGRTLHYKHVAPVVSGNAPAHAPLEGYTALDGNTLPVGKGTLSYYTEDEAGHKSGISTLEIIDSKDPNTAIVEVEAAEAGAEWYDLMGRRVDTPAAGLYIRIQGGIASKVIVK